MKTNPHFETVVFTCSHEQLVSQIERKVATGELASGDKLPTERELAAAFGVSRGVVRDAIRVLTTMGLVEVRQGSGVYVRNDPIPTISRALTLSVTPDELSIYSLFEFREPLETLAARLAAERSTQANREAIRRKAVITEVAAKNNDFSTFSRADWGFHSAIGEASGNPYLKAVLEATRQMQQEVVRVLTE